MEGVQCSVEANKDYLENVFSLCAMPPSTVLFTLGGLEVYSTGVMRSSLNRVDTYQEYIQNHPKNMSYKNWLKCLLMFMFVDVVVVFIWSIHCFAIQCSELEKLLLDATRPKMGAIIEILHKK